jgi:uncharacterized protein
VAKNNVCFWELATHDDEKSVTFFRKLFDWDIQWNEKVRFYTIFPDKGEKGFEGGGIFTLKKAKLPFLTIYINVDEIEEKARRVVELGGYIVEEPFEIREGTKICLFNEPSGVTFAMIENKN